MADHAFSFSYLQRRSVFSCSCHDSLCWRRKLTILSQRQEEGMTIGRGMLPFLSCPNHFHRCVACVGSLGGFSEPRRNVSHCSTSFPFPLSAEYNPRFLCEQFIQTRRQHCCAGYPFGVTKGQQHNSPLGFWEGIRSQGTCKGQDESGHPCHGQHARPRHLGTPPTGLTSQGGDDLSARCDASLEARLEFEARGREGKERTIDEQE